MSSQAASGSLDSVTKSAVMNTLVTPSSSSSWAAVTSSASVPATKVDGPPTGTPTVNLRALGLGVLLTDIDIATDRNRTRLSSSRPSA